MTLLLPLLFLVATLLCIPAYIVSYRRGAESRWLPFVMLPGLSLWVLLTALGYGAQSLSNIVEALWLLIAGVVSCYVKVYVIDPRLNRPREATYLILVCLLAAALLLRTFMPALPE